METYNGIVRTPSDAIILFEACRLGLLPRVQRRLSEKERQSIRSGSVFVWDEREAGMRRWTDGKSWSASRVSGSFLTYREMEGKRGSTSFSTPGARATKTPESGQAEPDLGDAEEGLMATATSPTGQHLHLISYYSRASPSSQQLRQPTADPQLSSIQPAKGMYPESTVNDQSTVPAVTRSPMPGAPNYVVAAPPAYGRAGPHPHPYLPPGYVPHPAYMAYPLSPMHTPPPYALHYAPAPGMHPIGYPAPPYATSHALPMNAAPPSSYDQRPQLRDALGRTSQSGHSASPAPFHQSIPPPPITQSYSQSSYSTAPPPQPAAAESASEPRNSSFQIDPRLTAPPPAEPSVRPPTPNSAEGGAAAPVATTPMQRVPSANSGTPVTASQVPNITSLISEPDASNNDAKAQAPSAAERQGSASPGGTGAPPQDIPSEKLGFSADKRHLSMLDRGFARV
ncbi:cAMP-independent regulatory protein pac2 [Cyphellophora attinorum]|uniref:cAMP-independent regulatory protein pac2 n=1 Tax=Cyphellophora attinorum TaxID=1664694 RepID=A0A0N0NJW2_9EURO|nr:cAMP-independent regulatory protein pac2 [Phialophora attinorum]KPI37358.1 cAMP-independent regulatory protein pac2 [Phialophora attinorum]